MSLHDIREIPMKRFGHSISALASACLLLLVGCSSSVVTDSRTQVAENKPAEEKRPFDPTVPRTPKPSKSLTLGSDWQPPAPTRTTPAQVKARVTPSKHREAPKRILGPHPSDAEVRAVALFREPLRPVPGTSTDAETDALSAALREEAHDDRKIEALERFLEAYPASRWAPVLHLNFGKISYDTGYFQDALAHWQAAWELAKGGEDGVSQDFANLALAESAKMNARIGRVTELEALLEEAQKRTLRGDARAKITNASEGAWMMRHQPGVSFLCGPYALTNVAREQNKSLEVARKALAFLEKTKSPMTGFSIPEVHRMSTELGLKLQIAKRDVGAPVIVPSVVHWKLGHFAAVVREVKGNFLVKDPTFTNDTVLTAGALDREASGYFLVPAGPLPAGWSRATVAETAALYGKGLTAEIPDATGDWDHQVGGSCQSKGGLAMATYRFHTLSASVRIEDTPVGYSAAVGPDVRVRLTYKQRAEEHPTATDWTNFGPGFDHNWFGAFFKSSVSNTLVAASGRGAYAITNTQNLGSTPDNPLAAEIWEGDHILFPDGRKEYYEVTFAQSGTSWSLSGMMSRIVDPQGNEATIEYDTTYPKRIHQIVDATGLPTVFHYDYPGEIYLVTSIEDPFGRTATFGYAPTAGAVRLQSIEDVYGIVSSFTYDEAGQIVAMTTPYGTTTFKQSDPYVHAGPDLIRFVEATDPLGQTERIEYNLNPVTGVSATLESPQPNSSVINASGGYNNYRNSFYWDKLLMKLAPGDYQKAHLYHWVHNATNSNAVIGILESERPPLEGRIFYNYPGQATASFAGTLGYPSAIGRVVKDAAGNNQTQATKITYNGVANVTKVTDPAGRETVIDYGTNGIDVVAVKQKTGTSGGAPVYTTLSTSAYVNSPPHRPSSVTDGAGHTTQFTYTSVGQVQTIQNAKGEVTTLTYETNTSSPAYKRLLSITGDVPGGNRSLTYDSYGRVLTSTDSEGYVLTYDYDSLDRVRTVTHPDGSFEQFEYEDHSLVATKDRAGRWTRHMYNPVMERVVTQDPTLRTTQFQWCRCAELKRFVDGNGNITEWQRDEGRHVTKKIYPNGGFDRYEYDLSGRLFKETDPTDRTVTYQYAIDDGVTKKDYSDTATPDVTLAYDTYFPRVTSRQDGAGTTTYTYHPYGTSTNGAGQVSLVNGPLSNDTLKHTYDQLGRLKKLEIVDDATQSTANYSEEYTFDARGRVTTVVNHLGSTTYGFVGQSRRPSTVSLPNGMQTQFDYFGTTGDFLLKQIKHLTSGGTPSVISQFDYTYAADRSIATWKEDQGSGAKTWTFGYDDVRQLTKADRRDASQTLLDSLYYGYDNAGNRIQVGNGTTAPKNYDTNNLNQLLSERDHGRTTFAGFVNEPATVKVNGKSAKVTSTDGGAPYKFEGVVDLDAGANTVVVEAKDGRNNTSTKTYSVTATGASKTFEYDAFGNLRYEKQPNGTVTREYRWDQQNRLVKELHGTHESAYEYDGASRRWRITEKESGTQTKQETFVWCGSRICQKRASNGSTVVRSYFGNGFEESGPTPYFYTRDHLGSAREVVGSDGTTVASRLSYDPWGKVTESGSGALSDFTYTGHHYDRPAGLNLAQFRGYDPSLGRWLSKDPIGLSGGSNVYVYVGGDPVNATDSLGLSSAPTREELTFIAELLGVGNTAAVINEHDAMLSAAARGDADGVECHGRNAANATLRGIGELAVLGIMSSGRATGGGSYRRVRVSNAGGEVHHMPAWGAMKNWRGNPFSYGRAPGIWMERVDHMATASWGPGGAGWRAQTTQMLNEGRFLDALARDIVDVQKNFGSKYDGQIAEMLNYLWSGNW